MHLCSVLISSVFVLIASKEVVCNNHRCFKPHDCSGIKKRYPDSKSGVYQIYPDSKSGVYQIYPDSKSGVYQIYPDSKSGVYQIYPDSKSGVYQIYPDSKSGVYQIYPDSKSGVYQIYPDSKSGVYQIYPDSKSGVYQIYPDSKSGVYQIYPDSKSGVYQIYPDSKSGVYQIYPDSKSGVYQIYPDSKSGVYQIYPDYTGIGVHVYCDMDRSCGGWTVIQRRMDGTVNFYRDWIDYKYGFGKPDKEHWIGNNVIHQLTRHGNHELLIVMEDFDETVRYAHYGTFFIGNENEKYKLNVTKYSGNAGDSLVGHNGYPFTTKDQDNDKSKSNCATEYKGAWWYTSCHSSNLNGLYLRGATKTFANGVVWHTWKKYHYSLKSTILMIR